MLRSINEFLGYAVAGEDGTIGKARDMLFDDARWSIRYLVVDTGEWLPGRKVILAPDVLERPSYVAKIFPVRLTRQSIEDSPPLESDKPVSKRYEESLLSHYGWSGIPHTYEVERGDARLRSAREVVGYHIDATDGRIGHVEDFIVDDNDWAIRYLVLDTKNWLPGKKVLVSPQWVERVDWTMRQVSVGLTREAVEESPEYDPTTPINRQVEERLYDFHGRPQYWTDRTTV